MTQMASFAIGRKIDIVDTFLVSISRYMPLLVSVGSIGRLRTSHLGNIEACHIVPKSAHPVACSTTNAGQDNNFIAFSN